jgi:predicted transcriptional regulator
MLSPNNTREEIWTPKDTVTQVLENSFNEVVRSRKISAVREAYEQYQTMLEIRKQQKLGIINIMQEIYDAIADNVA